MAQKNTAFDALFSLQRETLFRLKKMPYSMLIENTKEAWSTLSNFYFQLIPLDSQHDEQFFWHCYHIYCTPLSFHDEKFQAALHFGHYEALNRARLYYLDQDKFTEALACANRTTTIYLAAGHAQLADTHLQIAQRAILTPELKKYHYLETIKAVNLALLTQNASKMALRHAHLALSKSWLNDIMRQCHELCVPTTKDDLEQNEKRIFEIYDALPQQTNTICFPLQY